MRLTANYFRTQFWREYWPRKLIIILGAAQSILSFIVLSLQSSIVAVGMNSLCTKFVTRYWVGFVCWFFFGSSSIATWCVSCCGQLSFGCATYGLVEQVVTCIFSAVLIDYNRKYIDNIKSEVPSNCSVVHGNSNEYLNISTSLAKSQLAAAVLMLSMALAYSGIYIYTIIQVILRSRAGDTLKNQEPNYTLSPFQPPLFSIQPYPRNPIPPASRRIPKLLPDTSEVPIQNTEDTDF